MFRITIAVCGGLDIGCWVNLHCVAANSLFLMLMFNRFYHSILEKEKHRLHYYRTAWEFHKHKIRSLLVFRIKTLQKFNHFCAAIYNITILSYIFCSKTHRRAKYFSKSRAICPTFYPCVPHFWIFITLVYVKGENLLAAH